MKREHNHRWQHDTYWVEYVRNSAIKHLINEHNNLKEIIGKMQGAVDTLNKHSGGLSFIKVGCTRKIESHKATLKTYMNEIAKKQDSCDHDFRECGSNSHQNLYVCEECGASYWE